MPMGTRRAKSMPSMPSRKPCTKCCRACSPSLTMSMPQSSWVFSAHQGRAVLAFELAKTGRDVADREADAAVERRVWRRAVHGAHVVQRHLAGPQIQQDRLRLVDLDRDLLAAGQEVVAVEGVT